MAPWSGGLLGGVAKLNATHAAQRGRTSAGMLSSTPPRCQDVSVDAWLAAAGGSLTTLIVTGIAFLQWRRSERRQLDQLQIIVNEYELKERQFEYARREPYRLRRATVLQNLVNHLAVIESGLRLSRQSDADMASKVEEVYAFMIISKSALLDDEVRAAQDVTKSAIAINRLIDATPISEREEFDDINTNASSMNTDEAVGYFRQLVYAQQFLADQLRSELGSRPA